MYVGGKTIHSERAIHQLRGIMEQHCSNNYSLHIIDIYNNLDAAEKDNIIAVPTVIKDSPPPKLRLIGSLSNKLKVMQALNLEI